MYNPSNVNTIYIVNEKEDTIIQCESILPQSEHGEKLEKYFQSIQMLKKVRVIRKRKRVVRKTSHI